MADRPTHRWRTGIVQHDFPDRCLRFLQFRENDRHYLFILYWLGFESRIIEYERHTRSVGKSSYSIGKLLAHALQGVFFQTTVFLRLVIYGGFLVSLLGLLAAAVIIFERFHGALLPGWTSLIVLQLLMSGLTISAVGTVGLYVTAFSSRPNSGRSTSWRIACRSPPAAITLPPAPRKPTLREHITTISAERSAGTGTPLRDPENRWLRNAD